VDVKEKVIEALRTNLTADYIRVEDDDGLSGFIVSQQFQGMSALDRQALIENAIDHAPHPLTRQEQRRVLMIAGLTPAESDAVGAGIRVHRVREEPGGRIEILLHGGLSDAEYVQGVFKGVKGVQTTDPEPSPDAKGLVMRFEARGTPADPLTKQQAIAALESDPYIAVMPGA
jgi:acid stress-induced BolA-like protein IbaG/YrbA